MVSSIKQRLIEFRDAHKQEWNDDLGEVVELLLDERNHLIYRSVLDMNLSGSKYLWYRIHTLGIPPAERDEVITAFQTVVQALDGKHRPAADASWDKRLQT